MRKLLFILVFSLLLFSCATYTIAEAREAIVYPESSTKPTRLKEIIEKEEAEKAERDKLKVNEYPASLSDMTLPFYYNPVKNNEYKLESSITEISTIFIPLGEDNLAEEALSSILTLLKNNQFSLTALSGSLSNQVKVASLAGKDAVTLEGGTIILDGVVLKEIDDESITLSLTGDKTIKVYNKDFHPVVPETSSIDETLEIVDTIEKKEAELLISTLMKSDEKTKLLFLSSIAPSTLDWTSWTDYDYRYERNFLFSDLLLSLNWYDAFALSRFSEETESGWTRRYYNYEERLDFIYSKGLIVESSYVLPIENHEERATVAVFLLP